MYFLWLAWIVEQTLEFLVLWDTPNLPWRNCNVVNCSAFQKNTALALSVYDIICKQCINQDTICLFAVIFLGWRKFRSLRIHRKPRREPCSTNFHYWTRWATKVNVAWEFEKHMYSHHSVVADCLLIQTGIHWMYLQGIDINKAGFKCFL